MTDVVVTLERWEIEFAGYGAFQRVVGNLLNPHAREKHGADTPWGGYDWHLMGMLGELATAKHLNMAWTGGWGDYRKIDVGNCVNVRARGDLHHHLILHEDDADVPTVCATVIRRCLPRVQLSGWLCAKDGKKDEHWGDKARNGRPAFWVPPGLLLPMAELRMSP